jgi:predicted histone-like DNA-binding protein
MPITVKPIRRINPRNPEKEGKYYLTVANQKKTDIKTFCENIQRKSGLQAATIRAALFAIEEELRQELSNGYSVHLRELGSFSLSLKSDGDTERKKAKPNNIKSAKIIYRPGREIKKMLDKLDFEWE